jgi:tetratricopeptide (TPR) repeat protein
MLKENFLLSATKASACSYADLLDCRPTGAALVGNANSFLSHSYGYRFFDVIEAVRMWEARQEPSAGPFYYYFDLAVVNQHSSKGTVKFNVLRDEFGESVKACGRTLLMLRWADRAYLATSRAWCIFEVATTLAHLGPNGLEVIMPPADTAALCRALVHDFSSVEGRLCTIDAATADAREQDDLNNIRCMIEGTHGGYGEVNERVLGVLREYVLSQARGELDAGHSSEELEVSLGDFLRTMSRTKDATMHLERVLAAREALLKVEPSSRERQLSVARALSSLGSTVRLADGSGSIAMLHRAWLVQTKHLPPSNGALLETIGRLGVALKDAGKYDEAKPLYECILEERRRKLGEDHPDTNFSRLNLAILFFTMGQHSKHDEIVLEVIARYSATVGERHPRTLFARHRLGLSLLRSGKLEDAFSVMKAVCQLQAAVLGNAHKETLSSRSLQAQILHKQGRTSDALSEFMELLNVLHRKFGATHVDSIQLNSNLAEVLFVDDLAAGLAEHSRAVKSVLESSGSAANPRIRSVLDSAESAAMSLADAPYPVQRALAAQLLTDISVCRKK